MLVIALFSFLMIVLLPRYSLGTAVNKPEVSKRTKDVLLAMHYVCTSKPKLLELTLKTKKAYAKEHFGDPLESRQININGIEQLRNFQNMTVQIFVPKAYKQLSIFQAIFEDILRNLSRANEKQRIVKKLETIKKKTDKLKEKARISAVLLYGESMANGISSSVSTSLMQQKAIWTKSAFQQKTWILGVLREFRNSLIYLQPAFYKFSN